jgi:hypothetical protein
MQPRRRPCSSRTSPGLHLHSIRPPCCRPHTPTSSPANNRARIGTPHPQRRFFMSLHAQLAVQVLLQTYPTAQVKSSSNTPVMQRTRRAHKERGWYAPHYISLASCPSGRRSGWAERRFDSLVLSEVPDVVLCLCAQGVKKKKKRARRLGGGETASLPTG